MNCGSRLYRGPFFLIGPPLVTAGAQQASAANALISQLRSAEPGLLAESSAGFLRQTLNGFGQVHLGDMPPNARGLVRAVWQVHVTGADG